MMHWFYWGFPRFFNGLPNFCGGFGWVGFLILLAIGMVVTLVLMPVFKGGYFCHSNTHGDIRSHDTKEDEALEVLRTLYARGEITEEEFERRKRILKNRD